MQSMRKYSIVTPVFNRPDELAELLESLANQTISAHEIIIVEDGSTHSSEAVCQHYAQKLPIRYFKKANSGQGFSRNYAFERATGDYFIQLDSDAVLPPTYLEAVESGLNAHSWDAFGGPDAADESFTPVQKAINYAMTSLFTTGGIRGKKDNLGGQFHPRSFNFGLSKEVYETVGGYKLTRMAEDIEFSIRIVQHGFRVGLIPEAFVYHKRRTSFSQFFKQLHFFGRGRINLFRFYPSELKAVHTFPAVFLIGLLSVPFFLWLCPPLGWLGLGVYVLYFVLVGLDATRQNKSLPVGILSIGACVIQLSAYGIGFLQEFSRYLLEPKPKK